MKQLTRAALVALGLAAMSMLLVAILTQPPVGQAPAAAQRGPSPDGAPGGESAPGPKTRRLRVKAAPGPRLHPSEAPLDCQAACEAPADREAPNRPQQAAEPKPSEAELTEAVERLNEAFASRWRSAGVTPAPPAPPLAVARRLSLALVGATPSLEEVRLIQAWAEPPAPQQTPAGPADAATVASPAGAAAVDQHLDALLADRRTADYLAERLARALVGDEDGPFLLYRRRRFVRWIADTLQDSSRYDRLVERVLSGEGLWTDNPAVNFITATVDDQTGQPDPELLAVRVSRVLLGVRLDCAQCHDHPFDDRWKQADFQALAAYFGGARFGEEDAALRGITDLAAGYTPEDPAAGGPGRVEPRPPFQPELEPAAATRGDAGKAVTASPRVRLAAWVTHPQNRAFARATAHRFWALLVGQPLVEPLDDIPIDGPAPPELDILADGFVRSGYDWRWLVRLIARSDAFRLESRGAGGRAQAAFPVTRLRGEQVAGAVAQSARLRTIDSDSHLLLRLARFGSQADFLRRYGDAGAQELEPASGSLTQRLLMMNGETVDEHIRPNLVMNSATRIAALAPDDATAVDAAYLTVLTRRPTREERGHFIAQIAGTTGDQRARAMADIYWALLNSTEFSWNH
ncbi:MAG: DUF1549 domain-containing protein [Planctomycetota bacterium]